MQKGERREWQAHVVRTEGVVDETSRVTYAVARIDDPYGFDTGLPTLPMGTFVSATMAGIAPGEMIRVPRSTVRGSNQLVFVDADNRIRIREVDVFRFDANYAYLRDTSLIGERVVVTALENPINGMQVRTTLDEPGDGADKSRVASSTENSP